MNLSVKSYVFKEAGITIRKNENNLYNHLKIVDS
jgi:hypothetical protein